MAQKALWATQRRLGQREMQDLEELSASYMRLAPYYAICVRPKPVEGARGDNRLAALCRHATAATSRPVMGFALTIRHGAARYDQANPDGH
jgi:hypothetical protein